MPIRVEDEQLFHEGLLSAQLMFKDKFGRFPTAEENNELIKVVESIAKEQKKNAEQTKTDWNPRC